MMALTLAVVGRALFSTPEAEGGAGNAIARGFSDMVGHLNGLIFPGATWLLRTPLPFARRLRRAQAALDERVYRLIGERRQAGTDTGDLLSTLLLAEDAERAGERLSDLEVRDQMMTLFFAGQETTANVLIWIWWLLAKHPAVEARTACRAGPGARPPGRRFRGCGPAPLHRPDRERDPPALSAGLDHGAAGAG